jgi:hypothetical protein
VTTHYKLQQTLTECLGKILSYPLMSAIFYQFFKIIANLIKCTKIKFLQNHNIGPQVDVAVVAGPLLTTRKICLECHKELR